VVQTKSKILQVTFNLNAIIQEIFKLLNVDRESKPIYRLAFVHILGAYGLSLF